MTFNLISVLTIVGKNFGIGVADSLTFGGASAIKNSLAEIKSLADQSNNNLFYWQIKTFLDVASDGLSEEEVASFLNNHPQGYRLGAEVFKILESTYLEKQAELIAIAFRQRIKGIIFDTEFDEHVHIISQLNRHLISIIEEDLGDIKREIGKDTEISEDIFLESTVDYFLGHTLHPLGFIEEELQYIESESKVDGRPKLGVDLEKNHKRTMTYFDFYSKTYQFL